MLAQHVMLRLQDDRVIAPTTADQRALARAVLAMAANAHLLAFRAADTHLHLLLRCERGIAGEATRHLELRLRWALQLAVGFAPLHVRVVDSQAHLHNAFGYILRQDRHHGFGHDPHHEASSLPDLLGLRPAGAPLAARVRQHLPRVTRDELVEWLGADLRATARPCDLPQAAAAAVALSDLRGNEPDAVLARRAAVHIGAAFLDNSDLAALLELTPRAIQRLRQREALPALVRAVRLQLALRAGRLAGPTLG